MKIWIVIVLIATSLLFKTIAASLVYFNTKNQKLPECLANAYGEDVKEGDTCTMWDFATQSCYDGTIVINKELKDLYDLNDNKDASNFQMFEKMQCRRKYLPFISFLATMEFLLMLAALICIFFVNK